jgi:hypothetical protein
VSGDAVVQESGGTGSGVRGSGNARVRWCGGLNLRLHKTCLILKTISLNSCQNILAVM